MLFTIGMTYERKSTFSADISVVSSSKGSSTAISVFHEHMFFVDAHIMFVQQAECGDYKLALLSKAFKDIKCRVPSSFNFLNYILYWLIVLFLKVT